jgi:hemoglobin
MLRKTNVSQLRSLPASADAAAAGQNTAPDLDSRERVAEFVQAFYARLLRDTALAPIFLDVARIDLAVHLPHIQDYWSKLLLGDSSYQRHTMNIHRHLNQQQALGAAEFERWLALFVQSVDAGFRGRQAEKAKRIAATIAANMQKSLAVGE